MVQNSNQPSSSRRRRSISQSITFFAGMTESRKSRGFRHSRLPSFAACCRGSMASRIEFSSDYHSSAWPLTKSFTGCWSSPATKTPAKPGMKMRLPAAENLSTLRRSTDKKVGAIKKSRRLRGGGSGVRFPSVLKKHLILFSLATFG